jgi:hypothetical protein
VFDFGKLPDQPKFNDKLNIIGEYGYDYMFENIQDLLETSNFTIANLETPLLDSLQTVRYRENHTSTGAVLTAAIYLKKYKINAFPWQ